MKYTVLVSLLALSVFTGCAYNSRSSNVYSGRAASQVHTVKEGTVVAVRAVKVEEDMTRLGAIVGGAAGGVAGRQIGSGAANDIATVGGAVGGGLAGRAIENEIRKRDALEITVEMSDRSVIAIVQDDDVSFSVGQPVRVLTTRGGEGRVQPI